MKNQPWVQSYDRGVPAQLTYPQKNLCELLEESALKFKDHGFTEVNGRQITYAEFLKLTNILARNFVRTGMKQRDRVALCLPNSGNFILTFFAILKTGAIAVGINPQIKSNEIARLMELSKVNWIISSPETIRTTSPLIHKRAIKGAILDSGERNDELKSLQEISFPIHSLQKFALEELGGKVNMPDISPDMPAILQFTGGTTGTPKAAVGLHRNLVANMLQFRNWLSGLLDGQEVLLAAIPLTHVYGLVLCMCLGIYMGARIVCLPGARDIELLVKTIKEQKVTLFPAVPTVFYGMNHRLKTDLGNYNLDSLKVCISGSSPLHPEVLKGFSGRIRGKLIEGYGLSEAPTATHCNPVNGKINPCSIGLPLPDVDCKVMDIETGRKEMPIGEIGELIIKGPQVMKGYFGDPTATRSVLRKGWLHTGDIVRMDERGYFYLVDRKKDVIKVSGFQVWPREVEDVLVEHPGVKEAAVAGVIDKRQGEKVKAWVVAKSGVSLTSEELRNWCKERLSGYKVPGLIEFIDEIPKTPVGKILRRVLISRELE